ncbi:MAG: hypothetical protein R2799_05595, partial [Crocinitomicaceae bacterium]
MNKYFKAFIITTAVIAALLFLAYKIFFSIDFIGTKDPKVVKENLERQKNMLIKADFRSGKFYCELELL